MPTVLVIGASRGIGLEFVHQYLDANWRVIATARDDASLDRLRQAGAEALRLDVASPESNAGFEWQIEGDRLDVAIYVAGVMSRDGARQPVAMAEFDRVMHTNVLGAMQLIPSVAPRVEAAAGRFVFLSSDMGSIADTDNTYGWLYRASKSALNMAVHAAQYDYPRAVLAVLSPGWVRTDMGGSGAPLGVETSVRGMRETIAAIGGPARGGFLRYDGKSVAW